MAEAVDVGDMRMIQVAHLENIERDIVRARENIGLENIDAQGAEGRGDFGEQPRAVPCADADFREAPFRAMAEVGDNRRAGRIPGRQLAEEGVDCFQSPKQLAFRRSQPISRWHSIEVSINFVVANARRRTFLKAIIQSLMGAQTEFGKGSRNRAFRFALEGYYVFHTLAWVGYYSHAKAKGMGSANPENDFNQNREIFVTNC